MNEWISLIAFGVCCVAAVVIYINQRRAEKRNSTELKLKIDSLKKQTEALQKAVDEWNKLSSRW